MADIGRHIAKYRKAKGLTQDALGERVHVTRQTISSWEVGRTLPDIQMLSELADSLEVSVEQLIYGRDTHVEPRDVTPYRWAALISVLATIVCIVAALLLRPDRGYTPGTYRVLPELLSHSVLEPLAYMAGTVCFFSLLSLIGDIAIPHRWPRLALLILGAGLVLAFAYGVAVAYAGAPGGIRVHFIWLYVVFHPYLFVVPGACLFFGLNRRS